MIYLYRTILDYRRRSLIVVLLIAIIDVSYDLLANQPARHTNNNTLTSLNCMLYTAISNKIDLLGES